MNLNQRQASATAASGIGNGNGAATAGNGRGKMNWYVCPSALYICTYYIGFSAGVWYDQIDVIIDWHSTTTK